ncbi:MAG: DUF2628 domain-containing protein [Aestuariivirgaceae bacterium]|nr:DUF2628 domain-containing protein [Aestuariivirgaceae bacterium]
MRFFTVHVGPGEPSADGTRLVPEGFSWMAFMLPVLWLPIKGLWVPFVILVSLFIGLGVAETQGVLTPEAGFAATMAANLFTGLEGRNWQRHRLARLGFQEAGVVAGANLLDAETRWFVGKASAKPVKPAAIPSLLPWPGTAA